MTNTETYELQYELLNPDAVPPTRAHATDAGFDLHSDEARTLEPGEFAMVTTGVAVALPEGTVGLCSPRSGLAGKHGVTVLNAPGIVDSGYRGELKVILINHSKVPFQINVGDRIAQLVIAPFVAPTLVEAPVTSQDTDRGVAGFGSTGFKAL